MSERSSFVTDYIYCPVCFETVKACFLDREVEKYLVAEQISSWIPGEMLPIIAGKIGGLGPGDEIKVMRNAIAECHPCHPVRIVMLLESNRVETLVLNAEASQALFELKQKSPE